MSVRVKICGITSTKDALAAVDAGADALGFMFYPASPRAISPAEASAIFAEIPPFVAKIGVFVNPTLDELDTISGLNVVQLHGDESPEFCNGIPIPVIKAIRVRDQRSIHSLTDYPVSAVLLDAYVPGQLGGTGARFNWDLAVQAKALTRRIILAGGLTPENVFDAVSKVRPYAVDVSSGVESAPGRKDAVKLREFIAAAKQPFEPRA